jgi:hypothetical protein
MDSRFRGKDKSVMSLQAHIHGTMEAESVRNLWIVGSSPTMTMKRKQLQAKLEAVFTGLSFPT